MSKIVPNNNSFCSSLWNHLCVREGGRLTPCCRFQGGDSQASLGPDTPLEYLNSDSLKQLRSQALSGTQIPGCQECYSQERAGEISLRQIVNQEFPLENFTPVIEAKHIEYLELFVGSICNLKCNMCNGDLSTKWLEDYVPLGQVPPKPQKKISIPILLSPLKNLKKVKFVGGEPFLSADRNQALEILMEQKPEQISI